MVNDVVFDFDDEGEIFAPPIELFESSTKAAKAAAIPGKRLRALVLAPTRELAMQVCGKSLKFVDILCSCTADSQADWDKNQLNNNLKIYEL